MMYCDLITQVFVTKVEKKKKKKKEIKEKWTKEKKKRKWRNEGSKRYKTYNTLSWILCEVKREKVYEKPHFCPPKLH